ncbi:MAG: hypothetical protein H0Z35_03940 [Thermoanaerobacteraceae bacterium]|nr:hypothetical protein [Thermoanaerobacteraceae bacterium]
MPRCLDCGNQTSFLSSGIPLGTPWLGQIDSGLAAHFSDGEVRHIENMGVSCETAQDALRRPENYFDTCHHCGSRNIVWP